MGRKCAVILFISFWCGGCGHNQALMRCLIQERYLDSGDIGLLRIPDYLE